MRTLALCGLFLVPLLAGCTESDPRDADVAAADRPLALEVLDADQRLGKCNNAFRDQDILAVRVRLTNPATTAVGPPEYDVAGLDEEGMEYPMCWPDEVAIAAGDSMETELRFYVTSEECDVLKELVVRQLFAGHWLETRVATNLEDPCP